MSPAPKKRSRTRERLWTVTFTLMVTLVFGSGVSLVHVATQERVRENEALFLRRAVRAAAGLPSLPDADLPAWFTAAVRETGSGHYVVEAADGMPGWGGPVHVFLRAGAGLWGQIQAAVGVSGGPALRGVAILEQNETPGLGARIAEPWFAAQLAGKRGSLRLVPEGTRSTKADEIDAITGATITSAAVRDILNRVLAEDATALTPTERTPSNGQD